jgi:hypothetical protein
MHSKDALDHHKKVIEDLRAVVLQMPEWTSASLPSNWEALRPLIQVVRDSEASHRDQLQVLKGIRVKEASDRSRKGRMDALAIRRLTQRVDKRGMPIALYSWLQRKVLPDGTFDLPLGRFVVDKVSKESYLGPLHFDSKDAYSEDVWKLLENWRPALNDMVPQLVEDVDSFELRQVAKCLQEEYESPCSIHALFPSGLFDWVGEGKDLADDIVGWARPVIIALGTFAWQIARWGIIGLGLPQVMQFLQGTSIVSIVSIVPMKVLMDSG